MGGEDGVRNGQPLTVVANGQRRPKGDNQRSEKIQGILEEGEKKKNEGSFWGEENTLLGMASLGV